MDECEYDEEKIAKWSEEKKRVRVRYEIDLEIEVPIDWDEGDIEFQRNESSWCANNSVKDIVEYINYIKEKHCLCPGFSCTYLGESEKRKKFPAHIELTEEQQDGH